jgi:hypothetical protein
VKPRTDAQTERQTSPAPSPSIVSRRRAIALAQYANRVAKRDRDHPQHMVLDDVTDGRHRGQWWPQSQFLN